MGAKLCLAIDLNKHDKIAMALISMCVNVILVTDAEPLLFLDYSAFERFEVAVQVKQGIATGRVNINFILSNGRKLCRCRKSWI